MFDVFFDEYCLIHDPFPAEHENPGTAYPTWGDIFECCFKTQSSKLESQFQFDF